MRYWLLTTEYPPDYGGGIGTYCFLWAQILQQRGHEVSVFVPDRKSSGFDITNHEGIRIIKFSPYYTDTSSFLGYETMVSYSFASVVESFIGNEGQPDWIEAQEYNGIAYYLLQKKHLGYESFRELKVIITCHCPSFVTFQHNHVNTFKLPYFWIGEMERFCIQAADICISPSKYLADYLRKSISMERIISVIHNPFKVDQGKRANKGFARKAVFIGKLSPAKGVLQAIDSFRKLWDEGSDVKLQLIGDEFYYYHALQSMMGKHIRSKFRKYIDQGLLQISGLLPPQRVEEEVKSALVVLLPSTVENFPYSVVECMAAGKVVLSSMEGGQREIIVDGENGFLFSHKEVGSFVSKLKHVLSLPEETLIDIGTRAAVTIEAVCDFDQYYRKRVELMENYNSPGSNDIFPFVHHVSTPKSATTTGVKDLLSIVIPFYNLGPLLFETLRSLESADYPSKEIIIVNDGSDDEVSKEVLEELGHRKDIKIINQSNSGLAVARNVGALNSSGEFLAFLDADDLVEKDYYSKAISILKTKSNVHFVGSWIRYFEGSANIWPAFNPEPPFLLFHNMVNSSSLVYYRGSFLEAGLNDPAFIFGMEDYDSVINMVKKGKRGVVLPELLFKYRVRKNSMARGFNKENNSYLYQVLAEKHKEFYASFASQVTSLLNANGPGYQSDNPTLDYHLFKGNSRYDKILRKVLVVVKRQPQLRRLALSIKNKF